MIRLKPILILLVLVSGNCWQIANAELRVELVQVLFRHGERTPRDKEMWPSKIHNESTYEPWGLGQLINQGKMREYRIGQMLRERYNDFLGNIYHPSDVFAVSTDVDRTKMSLQLVLAALYQPAPAQTWNEKLPWMPLPMHYMPEKVDSLMKPDFSPIYLADLENVRNSQEVLKKVSVYNDVLKLLGNATGEDINKTDKVYEIYNSLMAQQSTNQSLPKWCTEDIYTKIKDIVKLDYEIRSYTPKMKRLNGGTLIKRFIDNINSNEDRPRPRKIYLYSGHEVNIAGFVRAHNFTEPELPSYGCAIIFEKLCNSAGQKFIRMLLWTGSTEKLIPYKFTDNVEVLPIEKYLEYVKEVIPTDEEEYHKWNYITIDEIKKLYEETLSYN